MCKKGNKGQKAWRFPTVLAVAAVLTIIVLALYMAGNEFMTLTAVYKYLTMLAFIVAICRTFAMEIDREKKDEMNHEEGLR